MACICIICSSSLRVSRRSNGSAASSSALLQRNWMWSGALSVIASIGTR